MMRWWAGPASLLLAMACNDSDEEGAKPQPAAARVEAGTPACAGSPPEGACESGAVCGYSLSKEKTCADGSKVGGAPTTWQCDCLDAGWECRIVGGSYSIPTCPEDR